jgi:hypothetical protein
MCVIDMQTTACNTPVKAKARARWGAEREARAYGVWMQGVIASRQHTARAITLRALFDKNTTVLLSDA